MIRFLINAAIWLGSAAIGLLVANVVLADMSVSAESLLIDVVIFAAIQSVLAPFLTSVTARNARPLLGGVGLLTTVIALIATHAISSGLSIRGFETWVYASLIIWIATMLASLLLPLVLVKRGVARRRAG
jgi:hypothetical protein